MLNFTYHNPTKIIFGQGTIAKLSTLLPQDTPILFLYGRGSIKKNGVYDQVKRATTDFHVIEFGGIQPNPLYETCMEALTIVQEFQIGFILAVGGGSVIDAAKFIAAAACFSGNDPWEILTTHGTHVHQALPIGTVLTLPATGTESNGNSVISRQSTQEKLAFSSPHVFPVFSILDPQTTFSLPKKQIRNGIVDAFVHVMEQYMTPYHRAPLQDRLSESIIQTLIEVGPSTLQNPHDYDKRATFMWCTTLALNNLIGQGVLHDWATHMIGHELTAFYGLDHAETLAIVLPGVWEFKLSSKQKKLEQYGQRIWNVQTATEAILRTEKFFHQLGMPTRLSDYQISAEEASARVRDRLLKRGVFFGEDHDIGGEEAATILRSRA